MRKQQKLPACVCTDAPHVSVRSVFQGRDSLPQLLQITDGFLLPSVLEFEIGSFPYERQVRSRPGLKEEKGWLITHWKHSVIQLSISQIKWVVAESNVSRKFVAFHFPFHSAILKAATTVCAFLRLLQLQ